MAAELIVRGGTVVTPEAVFRADIAVEDGKIAEVSPAGSAGAGRDTDAGATVRGAAEIDARGLYVFPGLVDAHVHFNDPGRAEWEGVATGSAALAAGGGTVFIDMPLNSSPPTLDAAAFDAKLAACEGRSVTDFALYGGLTPVNLESMEELAARGVAGFKAFMCPSGIDDFQWADDVTLYRGMQIAAGLGLPVLLHAENAGVIATLSERAGAADADPVGAAGTDQPAAVHRFLESRPVIAELEAVNRALLYAEETGCRVHIVHNSTRRAVELIRRAADSGRADATAETCPHYLFFTETDMEEIGARAKCAPPLRSETMRRDLVEAVMAGEVDTVGSDHSPASPEIKDTPDFARAWGGIPGVQTTLRTLLTVGVPPERIAAVTAESPAARFALPGKGRIDVGFDADLTLCDINAEAVLARDELRDRHRLSPYAGRTLRGRIERVLLRGQETGPETRGRFLRPNR